MADVDIQWMDGPLRTLLCEPSGAVGIDLARRGLAVESSAKGFAPVDTGRLRSSIRMNPGPDASAYVVCVQLVTSTGAAVTIGSDVEYAGYQELGTRYMPAHPYLRPGLAAGA